MPSRGAFAAVVLALTAFASPAFAEPTAECADAADRGQRARKDGKLQDARDHFLSCSAPMCPESIQKDCLRWANDTIDLLPTIVVDATDEDGRDIGDAKVLVDGYEVAAVTEGRSLAVDPGPHALRVERAGYVPVVSSFIAKEGMHARRIPAVLVRPRVELTTTTAVGTSTDDASTSPPSWALVASGIGAAATTAGFLVVLASTDMNASDGRDTVRGIGWAALALGGAATLTGLFAYFSEPAKPRARAAGVVITPAGAFGRF